MGNYWAKYVRKDTTSPAPAALAVPDSRLPLYVVCKSRPVFTRSLENALTAYTEMSSSVLTACVYMYTDKGVATLIQNRETEVKTAVAGCTRAPPKEFGVNEAPVHGCVGKCKCAASRDTVFSP